MKKPLYILYLVQIAFILPSVLYWLDGRDWSLDGLTVLNVFPLLGLTAFTMMWMHLMVAYLRHRLPDMFDYSAYYRQTSHLVLSLIILHPLLLIINATSNNYNSFDYAGESGRIFVLFGSLALSLFLVFEVVNRLREKPFIKNNWQYVVAMNRIGFILIFAHGLKLGQHLQSGSLRSLWLFYGVTTAAYFVWAFHREIRRDSK